MFELIKSKEWKNTFENIIELIKNTLDIDKTKNTIIEVVCKNLFVDCFLY